MSGQYWKYTTTTYYPELGGLLHYAEKLHFSLFICSFDRRTARARMGEMGLEGNTEAFDGAVGSK